MVNRHVQDWQHLDPIFMIRRPFLRLPDPRLESVHRLLQEVVR